MFFFYTLILYLDLLVYIWSIVDLLFRYFSILSHCQTLRIVAFYQWLFQSSRLFTPIIISNPWNWIDLYFLLIVVLSYFSYEFYFSIIFLIIGVCEGSLGLSILISLIRSHGNDYFNSYNVVW